MRATRSSNRVCRGVTTERGREIIADQGKTLTGVRDCTTDRLWAKFPSIRFRAQENTPYARNQVAEEFPKAVTGCIVA